jgi:transmembrane sensor
MPTKPILNRQIAEEAADWAVRIDAGTLAPDERAQLARWLSTSPVHVEELLLSASLLAAVGTLDREATRSIEALLAEPAPEIIPLLQGSPEGGATGGADQARLTPARRRLADSRLGVMAASLVVLLLASAFLVLAPSGAGSAGGSSAERADSAGRLLETGFGEQRSIVLEDGSVLYINTSSQVRVTISDAERRLDLMRGEALFEVAHDPERPFRVFAGSTVAQAVGTKFNVKRTAEGVNVVVVEGKVLVGRKGRPAAPQTARLAPETNTSNEARQVLVLAGDQADMAASSRQAILSPADIPAAISWRHRKVAFRNEGLNAIAEEFNRYNRRKIAVDGEDLSPLRFSGIFEADDPESFVAFLELTAGVEVDRSQPDQITIRPSAR